MKVLVAASFIFLSSQAMSETITDTMPRISSKKVVTILPTGETVLLIKSGKETNGEYAEFEVTLPPGKPGPPLHKHPLQSEHFIAVEGTLTLMADGKKVQLNPNETFTVKPGVTHAFSNETNDTLRWRAIIKPALNFEYLSEETVEAVNRAYPQMPSSYELVYILAQAKGEYYLADKSMFTQKVLWPVKAFWGKITGKVKQVRRRRDA
ncbi:cupin domain-containing protein [Pseudoflavitalea sp. G-6-1-2]|uniref:cupin domain-containing protein n=1 Tax=Pseudoflavitalea sp. G-6-1-2 TaxID=2728841 RepID=UPI00146A1004|nr:cupin domain-containing protein [Pseudoflavitalea sp. G-6-1-2]NML21224.1 cupin domain-containing protein [Pseudoflavitalea sp. G-6-1-2]